MVNNQVKKNSNLWDGKFRDKELKLYSKLNQKDIDVIMTYQKLLPILQDDNLNSINARDLWKQLVKTKTDKSDKRAMDKNYRAWINKRIKDYDFEESVDYYIEWVKDGEKYTSQKNSVTPLTDSQLTGNGYSKENKITLEMAKELCMIEKNDIGKISRKYFIAIEKAFKERVEWNKDRQGSINEYYNLREIVFEDFYSKNVLSAFVPSWWNIEVKGTGKKNTYAYELYLLDLVIIGTSAQEYRRINNLNKGIAIRNTFTEEQLEHFEILQSKSAEYLSVNNLWNTDERVKLLRKFYEYYKGISA